MSIHSQTTLPHLVYVALTAKEILSIRHTLSFGGEHIKGYGNVAQLKSL